jgi:hypothetical protein
VARIRHGMLLTVKPCWCLCPTPCASIICKNQAYEHGVDCSLVWASAGVALRVVVGAKTLAYYLFELSVFAWCWITWMLLPYCKKHAMIGHGARRDLLEEPARKPHRIRLLPGE